MKKKLFLLDAFALVYRAYFAFIKNPRRASTGKNTSAQLGFCNTLFEIINNFKPTHLAVAFDTAVPTQRHEMFKDYKAQREETPDDIIQAVPDIKNILNALNIYVFEKDGYEADDIIATIAKQCTNHFSEICMVTPDKDYGQVVSKNIFILKPPAFKSDYKKMGVEEICQKWNIDNVSQVIDYLAIIGDSSDNIPGIKGIGPKGAEQLLKTFETLESVYEHLDKHPDTIRKKLEASKDIAFLSKKLVTIDTNVPLDYHIEDMEVKPYNNVKVKQIFDELEFRTLAKRILGSQSENEVFQSSMFSDNESSQQTEKQEREQYETYSEKKKNYMLVQSESEIKELVAKLMHEPEICVDTETTGLNVSKIDLLGMSFSVKKHEAYYVQMSRDRKENYTILNLFNPLFEDSSKLWIGQNIKYDASILMWHGHHLKGKLFDTMLVQYILNPDSRKGMDFLSKKYLNYKPISIETLIGEKGKKQGNMSDVPLKDITIYAAEDADITFQLKNVLEKKLSSDKLRQLFYDVEMPLTKVLMDVEHNGFALDVRFLENFSLDLQLDIEKVKSKILSWVGEDINLLSPKQLGDVLFEKLKIAEKPKKTKTGQYSTDEIYLQKLSKKFPQLIDILEFRELNKLKSTYVDALPKLINPKTGKIHTSFNQALAVTGRLSSYNPNLQNIPIKTSKGKEIRKSFVASSREHLILSADYSQIELRILAYLSKDKTMTKSFAENMDIHSSTASKVFNVPIDKLTKEMRYKAKSINFGILYGQSAFGLSETSGIPMSEAKEMIDNYFTLFSHVKQFIDKQINTARDLGYVQTMLGRRRYLHDLNAKNSIVRGYAERNAVNMPIQGTAADMIKIAMVNIHERLLKETPNSKMILQVHDELVFDVYKPDMDIVKDLVKKEMKNALLLGDVPVEVEVGIGDNWLEAH